MTNIRYEKHYEAQEARVKVDYITDHGQYHAAHWQNELEMIYLLNGSAEIILDGRATRLVQGEFIVIDSNRVFELRCPDTFMQISVHVDREFLQTRAAPPPGYAGRAYRCSRDEMRPEQLEPYLKMCDLFKTLVPLYIDEPDGYRLRTESIILEILFFLVLYFSVPLTKEELSSSGGDRERLQEILGYIDAHYREPLTLSDLAGEFGLSREYFSRLFHKSIGIPLTQHLLRVRISRFYLDLVSTDAPVMELLEKHGLTNYKLFSRTFREIYGGTPRDIRRLTG